MNTHTLLVAGVNLLYKDYIQHPTTELNIYYEVMWKPSPLFLVGGPMNVACRITSVD